MDKRYKFHAFISHAVEDKINVANDLHRKLKEKNLSIWYSSTGLEAGRRFPDSIKDGLAHSRFCIVVLSHRYLEKKWTMDELNAARFREEEGFILPVLYDITPEEAFERVPELRDIWALRVDSGIENVVEKVYEQITKHKINVAHPIPYKWIFGAVSALLIALILYWKIASTAVTPINIDEAVSHRLSQLQYKIDQRVAQFHQLNGKSVEVKYIDSVFNHYSNVRSYYRNQYQLDNGFHIVSARKNVELNLNMAVRTIGPFNHYGLNGPNIYVLNEENSEGKNQVSYALVNNTPLEYTATSPVEVEPNKYAVTIDFQNNIRFIEVTLTFARHSKDTKTHQMNIIGLKPRETYFLEEIDGRWTLTEVNSQRSETN